MSLFESSDTPDRCSSDETIADFLRGSLVRASGASRGHIDVRAAGSC
jgi:hypothetical protein